jgi:signal transduction histidine kinase
MALDTVMEILAHELELPKDTIEMRADQEVALLDRGAQKLAAAIHQFFQATTAEQRNKALPELRWQYLQQLEDDLSGYQEIVTIAESRASTLRKWASEAVEICGEIKSGFLARETTRDLQRAAYQLQKASAYIPVTRAIVAVTQMDHSLHALRDFVTADIRTEESWEYRAVRPVVDQAIDSMTEFAATRGVDIVVNDHAPGIQAPMHARDLQRSFTNLLHNAIKYSWSRSATKRPWVTVEIHANEREVSASFINWGVPIAKDEIDEGLIFHLGYRGRLSKDRNRLGTGIGLTDAAQVAQAHGGSIQVDSHPASSYGKTEKDKGYYEQAFLTTVSMNLSRNPARGKG